MNSEYEANKARREKELRTVAGRRFNPNAPHGTTNGYTNYRCMCEDCTAAWNEYCSDRRKARRKARDPRTLVAQGVEHGKLSTYFNHGCQCEPCLAVHREKAKERRRG
jgi:hypothetical protein